VLGLMVHGPGQLFTANKPVRSLEDLKGLKIRASAGTMTAVIAALGAVAVPAPPTKSYEVLSNGVVDGTLFPPESVMGFNLVPLLKHETYARGGFYKSSFVIMMNQAKWDGLPEADKKAIAEISGEAYSRRAGKVWDRSDEVALGKLKDAKMERIEAQGAFLDSLQKQLAPLTDEWLKLAAGRGVDGKAALGYFREQMRAAK
jgi:TRAP-type C4-dicarboxylate transport system substrate-binding protein